MKNGGDSALSTITRYASSHIYRQVLNLFTSVLRPKFLSPEQFGLWNLLFLIPTYCSFLNFGTFNTARFAVPYHRGRGEDGEVREVLGSAFFPAFLLTCLAAAGALLFALRGDYGTEMRLGLAAMAALSVLTLSFDFHRLLLKAFERFDIIASSHYLYASLVFLMTVSLVPLLRLYGVYLTALLSALAALVFLRRRFPFPGGMSFSLPRYRGLIVRGVPIMLISSYAPLMRASDKFIVSLVLGNEQLGYFGLAAMVIGFLTQIPGVSREVLEPRLMRALDGRGTGEVMEDFFLRPLFNTACYMPFLAGPVFFLADPAISLLLPRYGQAVWPSRILAVGMYFTALTYVFRGVIVALGIERPASLTIFAAMLLQVLISLAMALSGFGITAVAAGGAVSNVLLLLMLTALLVRRFPAFRREAASVGRRLLEPAAGFLGLLTVLEAFGLLLPPGSKMAALLQTALFLLGAYALAGLLHRRNPLVARLTPLQILRGAHPPEGEGSGGGRE